jgi:hypothetical protein
MAFIQTFDKLSTMKKGKNIKKIINKIDKSKVSSFSKKKNNKEVDLWKEIRTNLKPLVKAYNKFSEKRKIAKKKAHERKLKHDKKLKIRDDEILRLQEQERNRLQKEQKIKEEKERILQTQKYQEFK